MRVQVFPLDFMGKGGYLQPSDQHLFSLAKKYCAEKMRDEVNLGSFSKVWVACRVDEEGNPVEATGISGYVMRPDVMMFRSTDARTTKLLTDRLNAFFSDQGLRGQFVFVFVSPDETEETRCANADQALDAFRAMPSERYSVLIR